MNKKLAIIICTIGILYPLSDVSASTILSPHKYAWSDNVGYINFENVTISDGTLSGFAWSANKGFINFNPTMGGVLNDGTGNLSGSAWGEGLGWVDFDGVSINSATGKFSGTATGTLVGTITFDCPTYCDVETDWRPAGSPTPTPVPPGSSGGGGTIGGQISIPTPAPLLPDLGILEPAEPKDTDIVKDGTINILDFNTLMVNWGNKVCGNPADVTKDCSVDIFDFNILMVNWGSNYQL